MKALLVYVWFVNGALAPDVEIQPWPPSLSYKLCKEITEGVTKALAKGKIYCHLQNPGETTESIVAFYKKSPEASR